MNKVISTERVPIKLWLDDIEEGALTQAKNLANLPFVFKHIALMPDSHQGYGMPIGGVIATKDVVIPNAVGVDIGCGMCAMKTSLREVPSNILLKLVEIIKKRIPVGFFWHKEKQGQNLMPDTSKIDKFESVVGNHFEEALYQLGTLGGGNHFIEIQRDNEGFVWIMIHSGSRNLGKLVADEYNKTAKQLNEKYFSMVGAEKDLAFLPIFDQIGQEYLAEMQFCVDFALANRNLMMEKIRNVFYEFVNLKFECEPVINIAHNYAKWENHYGQNVIIHRKGATSARQGEVGIVPGSMGTKSYIVSGLGNSESFLSCSHGAGRRMGRKQAQRELSLENEIKKMDDQGIIHGMRNKEDLDEASGAYKDIDVVMANQEDLVKILVELTPLAVIKG